MTFVDLFLRGYISLKGFLAQLLPNLIPYYIWVLICIIIIIRLMFGPRLLLLDLIPSWDNCKIALNCIWNLVKSVSMQKIETLELSNHNLNQQLNQGSTIWWWESIARKFSFTLGVQRYNQSLNNSWYLLLTTGVS